MCDHVVLQGGVLPALDDTQWADQIDGKSDKARGSSGRSQPLLGQHIGGCRGRDAECVGAGVGLP